MADPTGTTPTEAPPSDQRLRVLHLIKGLGPGGAEQLLVQQARQRDRARFEVRLAYVLAHKNHLVAPLVDAGVPVTCLADADSHWSRRLRVLLRDEPVDVVHCHSPVLAVATRLAARSLGRTRPLVVTTEHNRWPRHHPVTRWANRLTVGLDDSTLAVSDDVAASMPSRHRPPTLVHGIDIDTVAAHRIERGAVRAELGVGDDLVVGTVANLRPEKGYDVLLDAAAAVVAARDDVTFVLVGQGPLEAEIAARHRALGLGRRVRLLGYRADAARVLAGCDIFTMASRHEGLPVALMEALALGLPVVATTAGGIPQAVTDGTEARLVPVDDAEALAEALIGVADDPGARTRMSAAARRRAGAFDVSRSTGWLEDHYRRLIAAA